MGYNDNNIIAEVITGRTANTFTIMVWAIIYCSTLIKSTLGH